MGYVVRPMHALDIAQVTEVDREAFPTQWPPTSFKSDLNNSVVRHLVACEEGNNLYHQVKVSEPVANGGLHRILSKIKQLFNKEPSSGEGMFAQTGQIILGYASTWLLIDEVHLTSIAVRETHRRQGIGELLLISIIELAVQISAQVVTLEVRRSNLGAQALYEKYGFARVGMRRGYYSEDGEDAVIMTTEMITSASYQARFRQLKLEHMQRWGTMRCCLG